MSKCVIKHIHLLEALAKAKPRERKIMLEKSNYGLIKSIVECIVLKMFSMVMSNWTDLE